MLVVIDAESSSFLPRRDVGVRPSGGALLSHTRAAHRSRGKLPHYTGTLPDLWRRRSSALRPQRVEKKERPGGRSLPIGDLVLRRNEFRRDAFGRFLKPDELEKICGHCPRVIRTGTTHYGFHLAFAIWLEHE